MVVAMSSIFPVIALVASLIILTDATCVPSALYDPTYATEAAGKGAVDVSAWLHRRTSEHHTKVSYTAAWNALEASIDSHNSSHVRVYYGGYSPKCRTGSYYGLTCEWNREHLWPQSFGVGESAGLTAGATPRSDLHALVPSLKSLNSARSNRAFEQITDVNDESRCAATHAGCETPACTATTCGLTGTAQFGSDPGYWTPPPAYRGFIARAMFYMAVRYDGDEPNTYNLSLGEVLDKNTRGDGSFVFGTLSHLLTWHVEHPVEQWEKDRNDAVCATQGNRNPFTDKPDLVTVVFGTAEAAAAMKSDTSDAAKGGGGGGDFYVWSVVVALSVTWVAYIFGMFRWFV